MALDKVLAASSAGHKSEPEHDDLKQVETVLVRAEKFAERLQKIRAKHGIIGLLFVGLISAAGLVAKYPSLLDKIWSKPLDTPAPPAVAAAAQDLFSEPQILYIVYRNPDGSLDGNPQKWILHIHGTDTFTGDIELPELHAKGLISGYRRANVVTLSYASQQASDSGFGTFYLAKRRPLDASKGDIWAGVAVVHDCAAKNGNVCDTFRLISEPAMMSAQGDNVVSVVLKPHL